MLIQLFYNLLFPFVLLAMLPGFLSRMIRRGKYRHKFGQRFGFYSARTRQKIAGVRRTWMHAVSVGEVRIALKLAAELKRRAPGLHVVLSTTTSTGFALASKESGDWIEVIYNPVDFPLFVRRALDLIQPERLILVEAEVWPNLTWQAKRRGIPIALVNARLSPRSESRFRTFRHLTGPVFRRLDHIGVQEPEDVARWESLGVPNKIIRLTGSIKFDHSRHTPPDPAPLRALLASLGVPDHAPILVAGSTHPGEESILAEVAAKLRVRFPTLLLIVAPRHVERTPALLVELKNSGARVARRSAAKPAGEIPHIVLIDTTGELPLWYALADVVFVGKSLLATGGQNPVESVVAGRPTLFGPHMENFSAIAEKLVAARAAIQVPDADALRHEIEGLLADAKRREAMSAGTRQALAPHSGATARTAEMLFE